jgi:hypothetical protein
MYTKTINEKLNQFLEENSTLNLILLMEFFRHRWFNYDMDTMEVVTKILLNNIRNSESRNYKINKVK